MGRRLAGLPQGDGGQPRLPAEPRGDHRVLRGGRALRREAVAARLRPGRARRAVGRRVRDARPATRSRCRRAPCSSRRARRPTSPTNASGRDRSRSIRARRASRRSAPCTAPTATASCASSRRPASRSASSPATSATAARVTFYGDNNPGYAGSVVRAMASAKDGAPHVEALFARDIAGPRSRRTGRRATAPGGRSPASSTTSGGRRSRGSSG